METLKKVNDFVSNKHNEGSIYTFYQNSMESMIQFKEIFKDIPDIYNNIYPDSYIVTRKVTPQDTKFAYVAHFDNYYSTILIPLKVPQVGMNGEIVIWEKARKLPSHVLIHILTKLLFQNKIAYFIFKKMFKRNIKFKTYSVLPGDYACFDGFLDLHFNLPVDSGERISLLIHNNRMFKDSILTKLVEIYSRFIVRT